ncbi:hypothetical protein CEXT_711401 [Caerostris extrusa]|uniref:Uncharacterized protein n=1 Tax=Caerostris extrusa TaxID=172846 RepID=A0AAV4Y2F9_CAEEX|nr:hypothetical protein CEXT_711401 [Caerostris extrusa]
MVRSLCAERKRSPGINLAILLLDKKTQTVAADPTLTNDLRAWLSTPSLPGVHHEQPFAIFYTSTDKISPTESLVITEQLID